MFQFLMAVSCLYALAQGGRSERAAAIGYLVAAALTALVLRPQSVMRFEGGILATDALLYLYFAGIALRSSRYWPIWLTWFQGADVICQLAALYHPALSTPVYREFVALWSYPILALVAVATWRRRRDRPF